ncbi:hypothetical protein ACWGIN_02180 [Streptomyces sp. NPDC054861]
MGRDVRALSLPVASPIRPLVRAARIDNTARDGVPDTGRTAHRV